MSVVPVYVRARSWIIWMDHRVAIGGHPVLTFWPDSWTELANFHTGEGLCVAAVCDLHLFASGTTCLNPLIDTWDSSVSPGYNRIEQNASS